MLALFVKTPTM